VNKDYYKRVGCRYSYLIPR